MTKNPYLERFEETLGLVGGGRALGLEYAVAAIAWELGKQREDTTRIRFTRMEEGHEETQADSRRTR